MQLNLSHIGQIALAVGDVNRAEAFFGEKLGLRKLYRFGDLSFFDCAGVRLMLEKAGNADEIQRSKRLPTFLSHPAASKFSSSATAEATLGALRA
jgi:catechol 2,3-dioxygenase-like lactoylglutathione lyase family enzyme